jgi:hypothetical protein
LEMSQRGLYSTMSAPTIGWSMVWSKSMSCRVERPPGSRGDTPQRILPSVATARGWPIISRYVDSLRPLASQEALHLLASRKKEREGNAAWPCRRVPHFRCPTTSYRFSQSTSARGKNAFLTALKKIGRDGRRDAVGRRALAAVETSQSRHDGNDRGGTQPVGLETRTARVQRSRRRGEQQPARGEQQLARGEQPLRR